MTFRFTDNDFHWELRRAIEYVMDNREDDLSEEAWRHFVLHGMVAFARLKRISNFGYECRNDDRDYTDYIDSFLTVRAVDRLTELDKGFDGYVVNLHTYEIFYLG